MTETNKVGRTAYITCPICAWNRPLRKYTTKKYERMGLTEQDNILVKFDLENGEFISFRETKGYKTGFTKVEGASLTLKDIKNNPEYEDIKLAILEHCKQILEVLE